MVLGTLKLKHRNSTITPSTRGRDVAKEFTAKKNITKEFTIVLFETKFFVIRNSKIGWTEQKCIEMDNYPERNSRDTKDSGISHLTNRARMHRWDSLTLPSCSHNQEPSPPRIRQRTCRNHSFSTLPMMAPFFHK